MYNGYTESEAQKRARWQLMQKRAARRAKKAAPRVDRLMFALAIKRQMEGTR